MGLVIALIRASQFLAAVACLWTAVSLLGPALTPVEVGLCTLCLCGGVSMMISAEREILRG